MSEGHFRVSMDELQETGEQLGSVADHVEDHNGHGHSRQPQLTSPQRVVSSSRRGGM